MRDMHANANRIAALFRSSAVGRDRLLSVLLDLRRCRSGPPLCGFCDCLGLWHTQLAQPNPVVVLACAGHIFACCTFVMRGKHDCLANATLKCNAMLGCDAWMSFGARGAQPPLHVCYMCAEGQQHVHMRYLWAVVHQSTSYVHLVLHTAVAVA